MSGIGLLIGLPLAIVMTVGMSHALYNVIAAHSTTFILVVGLLWRSSRTGELRPGAPAGASGSDGGVAARVRRRGRRAHCVMRRGI